MTGVPCPGASVMPAGQAHGYRIMMPVPAGSQAKPLRTPANAGVFPLLEFLVKHSNRPCVWQAHDLRPGLTVLP